jgi:hypothetical protein
VTADDRSDSSAPSSPGLRITVPLFETYFGQVDDRLEGRRMVTPDVIVASLDETEAARVQASLLESWEPAYRLEIHGYRIPDHVVDHREDVEEVLRRTFSLLCCVVRATPRWPSVVLDRHDGERWQRFDWVNAAGGIAPFGDYGAWTIPLERLDSWGELLAHFPAMGRFPRLDLALDYFYDSVTDRKLHPHKAFMSASTAQEVLLGPKEGKPIRRTLAERGAALTVPPSEAERLKDVVGDWYKLRSKLVHEGQRPAEEDAIRHQQYLMRAIPSMGALATDHDSYDGALAALDGAAAGDASGIPDGFSRQGHWWSKVDVMEALGRPAL